MTPLSDSHGVTCLNHAIAITSITHQVLSETDILAGWQLVFQFQWNANLVMLGFIIANPVCPASPSARKAIETAMRTLQLLSKNLASASSGIAIVQRLSSIAELLADRCRGSLTNWRSPQSSQPSRRSTPTSTPTATTIPRDSVQAITTGPDNLHLVESNQTDSSQSSGLGVPFDMLDILPPLQPAASSATEPGSRSDQMAMALAPDLFNPSDAVWMQSDGRPIETWPQFAMNP
ncbi:MAG: hypothetical protein M1822_007196 [Bathelium mastoideum]|nr:MAG: hypothetical protein M1822_007196 [Bathelium mastoideum]